MKNRSSFDFEKKLISQGYELIIGIDEAGRGPLAGPVVASACALRTTHALNGHPMSNLIRDSKTLSEKQREDIYDFILENFHVGVGICDHETIDRINILEATYLAMKCAVSQLKSKIKNQKSKLQYKNQKLIILVDGNKKIPNISIEQLTVISGDKIVKSISAASIVAKVTRDRIMHECHKKYPTYGFNKHKGYGTALHMEKLKKHGPCEIHRKSFGPVKESIKHKNM